MSKSDYYRPSEQQITQHYKCAACNREHTVQGAYGVALCHCGGEMIYQGESYPASSDDWNEQRDPDGEWRERRY